MTKRLVLTKKAFLSVVLIVAVLSSCFVLLRGLADEDTCTLTIDAQGKQLDVMEPITKKTFNVKKGEASDISFLVYQCEGQVPYGVFENSDGTGTNYVDSYSYEEKEPYNLTIKDFRTDSDKTLYVCFCNPISITFNANGGTFNDGAETYVQKRAHGLKVIQKALMGVDPSKVKRDGYTFKGWSNDPNAQTGIATEDYVANANETVYAVWENTNKEEPKPAQPENKLNGLNEVPNQKGTWALYKDGKIDTGYTGYAKNKFGWWRVEKGYVNFKFNGVVEAQLDEKGWYKFTDGHLDTKANGIYSNKFGWWKTTNGKVTFKETGVFQNEFGWWRVKDSKVDFNANGIYSNKLGWWKTTKGKVTFKENGLFSNEFGTWKVENSKVNFNYNGKYQGKTIKNGKVVTSTNTKTTAKAAQTTKSNTSNQTAKSATKATTKATANTTKAQNSVSYVGNRNSKKFHRSTCGAVKNMNSSNKVTGHDRAWYVNNGYTACKDCKP